MAKKSRKNVKANQQTSSFPWESFVDSSTVSIFTKEGSLDKTFLEVGDPSLLGSTTPY